MNIMEKPLGFLSVLLRLLAVWEAKKDRYFSKTEDEKVKNLVRELGEMTKETQKMIERMDKRHQETMEYLGSFIKADGEKTRELINRELINKVIEKIPG
jgi:DNA-directed RNA polymerase subunit F